MLQHREIDSHSPKSIFNDYVAVSLRCDELNQISQYFKNKKNISMHVESYLPGYGCMPYQATVIEAQKDLSETEYAAGYLYTGGIYSAATHVECLILTKTRIIKPVRWNTTSREVQVSDFKNRGIVSTNLFALAPQSDGESCASLSLMYLKQLLKDDSRQLKELCFIFPYMDPDLEYCFIPSPQVLRYSQSLAYNRFIQAVVAEEQPGSFIHKGKTHYFNPVSHLLKQVLAKAREESNTDLINEAELLLEQLPAFRERWLKVYEQVHAHRSLMDGQPYNSWLVYTTGKMKKIILSEEEQKNNPGLMVLKTLEMKKNDNGSCAELLDYISDSFSTLTFKKAYQIGYFLNAVCELLDAHIEQEKIYQIFFANEAHIASIRMSLSGTSIAQAYKECLLFLNAKQRKNLAVYFQQSVPFSRLLSSSVSVKNLLPWLINFDIHEEDKIRFLKDAIPPEQLADSLLMFLDSVASNTVCYKYFKDIKKLANFLMISIGKEYLIKKIPDLNQIDNLKIMFESERAFYDFMEDHLLMNQIFRSNNATCNYLDYLPPGLRSTVLLRELNNPCSELLKRLFSSSDGSEELFALLKAYCDELEITDYLTIHPLATSEQPLATLKQSPATSELPPASSKQSPASDSQAKKSEDNKPVSTLVSALGLFANSFVETTQEAVSRIKIQFNF